MASSLTLASLTGFVAKLKPFLSIHHGQTDQGKSAKIETLYKTIITEITIIKN